MNIWLPIVTNVLAALIVVLGIFEGRKNGFGLQWIKALFLCGAAVGVHLLSPIVTNLLVKIPVIAQFTALTTSFKPALNSVVYVILFLLAYLIVSRVITIIRNVIINRKVKADLNDKKLIKKQRKAILKSRSKFSKIVGSIFGIVTSLAFVFILIMPLKYVPATMVEVKEQINELPEEAREQMNIPDFSEAQSAFEYTLFGQLDKVTHIYDLVNVIGE